MRLILKFITCAAIFTTHIHSAYALQSAGALGATIGSQGIGIEGRTPISRNIFCYYLHYY